MRHFLHVSLVCSLLLSLHAGAQSVSVSEQKLDQCEQGQVVCSAGKAFSLSALQNGSIQLPVGTSSAPEYVLVNDTGKPVRSLQFNFFGQLSANAQLGCDVDTTFSTTLDACVMQGQSAQGDGTHLLRGSVTAPAQFTYLAGPAQAGIPTGAYFDLKTAGFAHAGQDRGFLTGMLQSGDPACTASTVPTTPALGYGQASPSICWSAPTSIVYGTPLSSVQLNALANVPGNFSYDPGLGAVLNPGVYTLTATFNPEDAIDFATTTAKQTLTVQVASETTFTYVKGPDANNPVAVTVHVRTLPDGTAAQGNVSIFTSQAWPLASASLVNGSYTWLAPASVTGFTVYAAFQGAGNVASSTSALLSGPVVMKQLYPGQ